GRPLTAVRRPVPASLSASRPRLRPLACPEPTAEVPVRPAPPLGGLSLLGHVPPAPPRPPPVSLGPDRSTGPSAAGGKGRRLGSRTDYRCDGARRASRYGPVGPRTQDLAGKLRSDFTPGRCAALAAK